MRKKIIALMIAFTFMVTFFGIKVNAQGTIMGETLVYTYNYVEDLPVQYVKGSEIKTYEYGGEELYDFRDYFEVYDNAEIILNMHEGDEGIDFGGYVWDMDFDIDEVGVYTITLSYEGVTGFKSNFVELEVIEEDVEAPEIFMYDRNFNKTRAERPEDFDREFEAFINTTRIYDKVDGIIKISIDDFSEETIEDLRNADLGDKHSLTLEINDKAGNTSTKTITMTIVDLKAPNIQNVKTITTRLGKRINYMAHLGFIDNYSDRENITVTYEIYSTLVKKNIWEKGERRLIVNKGNELFNYLRLTDEGFSSFIDYLEVEYRESYLVGDYFEVVDEEGIVTYFVINKKVETIVDDQTKNINDWQQTSDKPAKGKRLESFVLIDKTEEQMFEDIKEEYETGYDEDDFIKVEDLVSGKKYYIFIKEKEDELRDKINNIDFNKPGVSYVRVIAEDEALPPNRAIANYRVVVEDGISLIQAVLIANGIVLVGGGIAVALYYFLRRRK